MQTRQGVLPEEEEPDRWINRVHQSTGSETRAKKKPQNVITIFGNTEILLKVDGKDDLRTKTSKIDNTYPQSRNNELLIPDSADKETVWAYLLLGVLPRRLRSALSPVFSLEGVAQRSSAFPMSDSSSPACRVKL